MKIEDILKIIQMKETEVWSGLVETSDKDIKIRYHYFLQEQSGLPNIALMHMNYNLNLRVDYMIHMGQSLYEGMVKDLNNIINFILAMAKSCASKDVVEAHQKDVDKFQQQMNKQQIAAKKAGKQR